MIRSALKIWHRFRRDEDGSAMLVEFVIMVPLLFAALIMSVEMSFYSMRHMYLDRGLEMTVRYIRLHTNTPMTHPQIKQMICDKGGLLKDCESTLRLEMIKVNPRNFAAFDQAADCIDTSEDPKPVRGWSLGVEHELMLLRACVGFKPIFPTSGLGYALKKDGADRVAMISTAAFVQEPN